MNLFDFTYCGNYNRQIQNLAGYPLRSGVLGSPGITGS